MFLSARLREPGPRLSCVGAYFQADKRHGAHLKLRNAVARRRAALNLYSLVPNKRSIVPIKVIARIGAKILVEPVEDFIQALKIN